MSAGVNDDRGMRQVVVTGHGGPERLELRTASVPQPGPGQLRIRVRAAGVNFADIMVRLGLYPDGPRLPAVVGYEVAGVVDAVGEGVTHLKPGDRAAYASQPPGGNCWVRHSVSWVSS